MHQHDDDYDARCEYLHNRMGHQHIESTPIEYDSSKLVVEDGRVHWEEGDYLTMNRPVMMTMMSISVMQ